MKGICRGLLTGALLLISCATAAGTPAPSPPLPKGAIALRAELLDGGAVTLGQLRGRVVLVTLMQTWADPALIEVPRLAALTRRYKPEDLTVLCIALDDQPATVRIFRKVFEVPYLIATVEDRAALTGASGPFGAITTVPTSVLIDRSGHAVARSDGGWPPQVLEAAVERVLASDPRSK